MLRRRLFVVVIGLFCLFAASGAKAYDGPIADPIEPFNRAVFAFNDTFDTFFLSPVATAYKTVLPGFARTSISAFLSNLSAPMSLANELLQWDWADIDVTLRRFVVNSTLGVGGLIDVASYHGLPAIDPEDFGQTLAKWGVGNGFYVVMPLMGPTSVRDAFAGIVDIFFDPFNLMLGNTDQNALMYARLGLTVVNTRADIGTAYDDIMNNAVDPYVTFRSVYVQNRAYLVQDNTADSYDDMEDSQ
jgi:phospholipid-binding lipoprotein MlaA